MKDLIWPTSIEFDESGNVYVAESGYVYGDLVAPTPIFKINPEGKIVRFAEGFIGPVTDLLWYNRIFFAGIIVFFAADFMVKYLKINYRINMNLKCQHFLFFV